MLDFRRSHTRKQYALHGFILSLMALVGVQGRAAAELNENSLLYSLVMGDEVVEGPLDPSAYAEGSGGVGGARLAAVDGDVPADLMNFNDIEVEFASILTGNVVVGPLSPLEPDEAAQDQPSPPAQKPQIYTVQAGDTVAGIADRFNISTDTVLSANGLTERNIIKAGDHLTILPTSGLLHTVQRGDTVSELASRYEVAGADIATYNNLGDEAKLSIGQKLMVPGAKIPAPRRLAQGHDTSEPEPSAPEASRPEPVASSGQGWLWPTASRHIAQHFRRWHTGVDIDNRSRPPIYAAQDGTVSYAGWLGGYGNLLIVSHGNGLETYYAHVDKMYVGKGDAVDKGEAIAKMGSTGRSSGPHLHFEVRSNGRPINPMSHY